MVLRNPAVDITERHAEALVALLETFQPRVALKPFLARLATIVKDLEDRALDEEPIECGPLPPSVFSTGPHHCIVNDSQGKKLEEDRDDDVDFVDDSTIDSSSVVNGKSGLENVFQKLKSIKSSVSITTSGSSLSANFHKTSPLATASTLTTIETPHFADEERIPTNALPPRSPIKRLRNSTLENTSPKKPQVVHPVHSPTRSVVSFPRTFTPTSKQLHPQEISQEIDCFPPKIGSPRGGIAPLKSQKLQQRSPSPSSRCANRYHDTSRFMDDVDIVVDSTGAHVLESPIQKAFDTPSILARILAFDGSLAAYHKHYDLLVGFKAPHVRRKREAKIQRRLKGTSCHLAFLNRRFASMILGPEGLEAWKIEARLDLESRKSIARQIRGTSSRSSCSSLAKVFAIVIRNDAIELEYLLSKHIASIQLQATTISTCSSMTTMECFDIYGKALEEYVMGGDDSHTVRNMGLPRNHPFLTICSCWKAKECDYTTLLAELAYNAFVCGATDVLNIISKKHNTLWATAFGSSDGGTLLEECIAYIFTQPSCLEEHAQAIRSLMREQRFRTEDLHVCQAGSLGNPLHMAAAKGDEILVTALLDIGCDPGVRCDPRAFFPEESSVLSENDELLWYPEDWARVRGHTKLARFLSRKRNQSKRCAAPELQSVLSDGSTRYSVASSYWYGDGSSLDTSSCCSSSSDDYDTDDSYTTDDGYTEYTEYTGADTHFYTTTTEYTFATND